VSAASRGHLVHNGRKVLLKYHRLLSGAHRHPPNSVAALQQVLADGAEVVEFDIGLTQDEQFVLLHDATLERETDAKKGTWAETQRPFYILAGGRYRFRTCDLMRVKHVTFAPL